MPKRVVSGFVTVEKVPINTIDKTYLVTLGYAVVQLDVVTRQAGRSRVPYMTGSLTFITDLILPAALWPWGSVILPGTVRPC